MGGREESLRRWGRCRKHQGKQAKRLHINETCIIWIFVMQGRITSKARQPEAFPSSLQARGREHLDSPAHRRVNTGSHLHPLSIQSSAQINGHILTALPQGPGTNDSVPILHLFLLSQSPVRNSQSSRKHEQRGPFSVFLPENDDNGDEKLLLFCAQ